MPAYSVSIVEKVYYQLNVVAKDADEALELAFELYGDDDRSDAEVVASNATLLGEGTVCDECNKYRDEDGRCDCDDAVQDPR